MLVAPNTFKIKPTSAKLIFEVRRDQPVIRDCLLSGRTLRHGVAWPFRGVWLLVYPASGRSLRWDFTLGSVFDKKPRPLSDATFISAGVRVAALQRQGPPTTVTNSIRCCAETWGHLGMLGVDNVPFSLHLLENPVARASAIEAYLRENHESQHEQCATSVS